MSFGKVRTVTFLPTLVLEPLVWIFFDKSKAESFGHIRLETLVVVVDGCLTSDDWFAFGGIGLFFPDEKIKLTGDKTICEKMGNGKNDVSGCV